ncbi:MAG: flagellar hook-associated protein FlgK [Candidatus Zixiibacteriota bacterium]
MAGLFQTLDIGRRALLANQACLNTVGHNIANVDTPGYSRQRVNISATYPLQTTQGVLGTGVDVTDIKHIRDLFLGQQYRQENKSLGQWSYKEKIYSQIETMFNEPNDNTLSDRLNAFWESWSALSTYEGTRENILAEAERLTNGFHELSSELTRLQESLDEDIVNVTEQVNMITTEIAMLNNQIKSQELGGTHANDLRDRRDLLLDELSTLIDVNSVEQANGDLTVYMGSMSIVNGPESIRVGTKLVNIDGVPTHKLVWEGTSVELVNKNGQLKGLIDSRDKIVPKYMDELNTLARTIVEQVNAIHVTGYGANGSTGVNFFDPDCVEAHNICISAEILHDPSRIAASASGEEGDQETAVAISKLRDTGVLENGTLSITEYYNSMVGALGVKSREAQSFASNFDLLTQQISNSRESVQGVSLDEEMTNMVKYQQAYEAAARVITAIDEALDTVISGMGIVGR